MTSRSYRSKKQKGELAGRERRSLSTPPPWKSSAGSTSRDTSNTGSAILRPR